MNLIENLERLNFSRLEAQIYLALLDSEPMSAYQLAKKIEMSRPAIYNSLEHMLDKGMVSVIPNSTSLYTAQSPEVILEKIKTEMTEGLAVAKKELKRYREAKHEEMTLHFRGFQTVIQKAKEIVKTADREVYINLDFDITFLKEELEKLSQKGIKVLVFSFYDIKTEGIKAEYYSHCRRIEKEHIPSRLMIVVDGKEALAADGSGGEEAWKGMVSNNTLFVNMLSEHIHNDIYLLKLKKKYGKEIYEDGLFLHTDFEERRRKEK